MGQFGRERVSYKQANRQCHGGEGGIRTHGGRKATPVFETGALIHYATSPQKVEIRCQNQRSENPGRLRH